MDFDANPEETEAITEHQEDPSEEAAVETIGTLGDRSGDQRLAMGYWNPWKRWAKDNVI
jgi:hypothetical protein